MVTRVCGSVGRLNPTTVVNDENSHFETLPQWRRPTLRPKQYWPQRVRSVTPHTLNFVRDGIILADLHKSLQIWGWFLPKKIDLPTQGGGGRSGNFRGSKNQNSGKCHELSRKSIKFVFLPIPPRGFRGGGGGVGGQNLKSPVNFMNFRENR